MFSYSRIPIGICSCIAIGIFWRIGPMSNSEMTEAIDWKTAVEISDIPRVLEAIVNLEDSKSEDNAVCLIRIIASELRQRERTGEAVPVGEVFQSLGIKAVFGGSMNGMYHHTIYASSILPVGTLLYSSPPSPPSSMELLEKAAQALEARAEAKLSIIGLPACQSEIIQRDRAEQWQEAAKEVRALLPQEPSKEEGKV
jgi:Ni,Fe-hydrogenase III small subunit